MSAIEIRNLHAAYDKNDVGDPTREVLKGISVSFSMEKSCCILGSNGSGKTTLLRAITAQLPLSGEVLVEGKQIQGMKRREIAKRIAVMTQLSEVYFSYTVYETVMLGRYPRMEGMLARVNVHDHEVVEHYIKQLGLMDLIDRQIGTLSGGQLQRVFLARTFAQETPILLLDEPTNHLDLKVQADLLDDLDRWRRQPNHTLIGVFHDLSVALRLADTLLLLKDGELLAFGEKREILKSGMLETAYDFDVIEYQSEMFTQLSQ